ncbi:site-specific DNA-methyltransferase [Campylobacter mucosalis]|uniref:site-specific DNA-methyltransferase n=1 Tax=Campylobacter mucosalis TaxID=202 RepID=UPI00146FD44E|nr:site-specific DNA-methyltransferase [Campylobacter mucosalis]
MQSENQLINDIKERFGSLMNASSLAISNDERILEFLLEKSNFKDEYKKRFFKAQYGVLIFKKDEFLNFLDLKLLSASYTSFSNKIGLGVSEKKFLKNSQNVVLNFPFKDCVLKGSQSKDDDKNTELFFNNILAKSQIDVLFAPKVLNNFELIGEAELAKVLKNRPNLLIKGNNLIALHSLKEYFKNQSQENKVKLIYIDPPYNTGNDSFNYNDRFNHSTWLTFMKNRLEIARELLRDDGVIFVQCDDNEQAYLKVLMDEIFGRENFERQIIWRIGWVSGFKTTADIVRNHDTILVYSKNHLNLKLNKIYLTKENYQNRFNDSNKKEILTKLREMGIDKQHSNDFVNFIENIGLPDRYPLETTWNCSQYDKLNSIAIVSFSGEKISKMLDTNEFSGQKPEALLQRIIEISTNENDLVLDFFAGSGTTLAVAHKMKRRYIGIEQMDYIENITKERLKKVIEGEQGGISKAVEWSGGGNLIYCELASLNAKFIEKIENSNDENELNQIYENLQKLAFIDYRVDIQNDLNDLEFSILDFKDKKRILKKCLDRNMDYIPYADMNDSEYKIDDETKKLNDIFYNGGDDE